MTETLSAEYLANEIETEGGVERAMYGKGHLERKAIDTAIVTHLRDLIAAQKEYAEAFRLALHHQQRAEKAEQALALRGEPVMWGIEVDGKFHNADANKETAEIAIQILHDHIIDARLVPLYAAPISGEPTTSDLNLIERLEFIANAPREVIEEEITSVCDLAAGRLRNTPAVSGERVREACAQALVDAVHAQAGKCCDNCNCQALKNGLAAIRALPLAAQPEGTAKEIARVVVQDVAEIPDRNSPDDQPEMMLVTTEELRRIVVNAVLAAVPLAAQPEGK